MHKKHSYHWYISKFTLWKKGKPCLSRVLLFLPERHSIILSAGWGLPPPSQLKACNTNLTLYLAHCCLSWSPSHVQSTIFIYHSFLQMWVVSGVHWSVFLLVLARLAVSGPEPARGDRARRLRALPRSWGPQGDPHRRSTPHSRDGAGQPSPQSPQLPSGE